MPAQWTYVCEQETNCWREARLVALYSYSESTLETTIYTGVPWTIQLCALSVHAITISLAYQGRVVGACY